MDIFELMAEEEAKRLAEARAEIAAEQAAWAAMTPEQQQAVIDAYDAKYAMFDNLPDEDWEDGYDDEVDDQEDGE